MRKGEVFEVVAFAVALVILWVVAFGADGNCNDPLSDYEVEVLCK